MYDFNWRSTAADVLLTDKLYLIRGKSGYGSHKTFVMFAYLRDPPRPVWVDVCGDRITDNFTEGAMQFCEIPEGMDVLPDPGQERLKEACTKLCDRVVGGCDPMCGVARGNTMEFTCNNKVKVWGEVAEEIIDDKT